MFEGLPEKSSLKLHRKIDRRNPLQNSKSISRTPLRQRDGRLVINGHFLCLQALNGRTFQNLILEFAPVARV